MAANKFATKLDRNSHKIVVILVYAVLEWVLIGLLLFNSLFYYFIKKFASFFGLKPTCLWCSSVDCLFESGVKDGSYEGLFCEDHTSQISKIGYCLTHKKLVETQSRCQECSQGVDSASGDGFGKELSCSCCGKSLINGLLDGVVKESIRIEEIEEEEEDQDINVSNEEPQILSDIGCFYLQEAAEEDSSRSTSNSLCNENEGNEDEEDACGVEVEAESTEAISSSEDLPTGDGELHDESEDASENDLQADQLMEPNCVMIQAVGGVEVDARIRLFAVKAESTEAIRSSADLPSADGKFHDDSKDASENDLQDDQLMEPKSVMIQDVGGAVVTVEEEKEINYVEIEREEVGGRETLVSRESDLKNKDLATRYEEDLIGNETSVNEALDDHPDEKHDEETRSILENGKEENQSHLDIEEGELDNGFDPALSIERLRSELESERKAHKDLSVELEAERNAAAIAANQTMAMITRLQEEKAAIKMEAVQYQRMMEEQAEYDHEALQLLNELVIKREKEKQELEKELEVYQEKVLDYEVIKEKAMSLRKSGCSSSSCSLNEDSEKLSIDLNKEMPSTGAVLDSVDMVLDRVKNWNMLDGSLEEFEEERLSILHQLKELEEKLFSVCDDDQEEDEHYLEHQAQDNEVKDENASLCSAEVNLAPGGCVAELTMEKDHPTTMALAAKKLLPLLEKEDGDAEQVGLDVMRIESEQNAREVDANDKVLAVMKEMDHVYGRLQALEADREFLRHCIGSLNKGDKGAGLLEEILQHLRELRNADTCELMICNE